jgi:hypothetical protein
MARVTESDEGKKVVDKNNNTIGMISGVRGDTITVDPDPGITDSIRAKLGWKDVDEDDYTLDQFDVEPINNDRVQVRR